MKRKGTNVAIYYRYGTVYSYANEAEQKATQDRYRNTKDEHKLNVVEDRTMIRQLFKA